MLRSKSQKQQYERRSRRVLVRLDVSVDAHGDVLSVDDHVGLLVAAARRHDQRLAAARWSGRLHRKGDDQIAIFRKVPAQAGATSQAESKPRTRSTTLPVASGQCIVSAGAVGVSSGEHAVLIPRRKIPFWRSVTNANSANYRGAARPSS
jgi:hypothetical protein